MQKTVRGATDNADVPFQQVVADADVPRSAAYTPLFQSMVTLQESGLADRLQLDGLTIGDAEVGPQGGLSDMQRLHCCAAADIAPAALSMSLLAAAGSLTPQSTGRPLRYTVATVTNPLCCLSGKESQW